MKILYIFRIVYYGKRCKARLLCFCPSVHYFVEIVDLIVRNNKDINGFTINREEFEISQLSVDTTACISSLKISLLVLEKFSLFYVLSIDKDKTEVILLNIKNVDKHNLGISWQKSVKKFLKCSFSKFS